MAETSDRARSYAGIMRGAAGVVSIQSIGLAVGYVSQILLARSLGSEGYGRFTLGWSWMTAAATVAGLGLPVYAMRLVAGSAEQGDEREARSVAGFSVFAVGVAGSAIALISQPIMASAGSAREIRLLMLAVPSFAVLLLLANIGRAVNRPVIAQLPQSVLVPLLLAGAALLLAGRSDAASGVALVAAVGIAVISLGQVLQLRRSVGTSILSRHSWQVAPWLWGAMPLMVVAVARVVQNQADVMVLGTLVAPEELGAFNAAKRTAFLIGALLVASNALVAPLIARHHAVGELRLLQEIITRTTVTFFIVGAGITLIILVGSQSILGLFDQSYQEDWVILWILALGQLVNVGFGPSAFILSMTGRQSILARIMVVTSVLSLITTMVLTVQFGATGAAVASVLAIVIWNVAVTAAARRHVGVDPSVLAALRPSCRPVRGVSDKMDL